MVEQGGTRPDRAQALGPPAGLEALWAAVAEHFGTEAALARVLVMSAAASQTEGWWKAELMYLLERLRRAGLVEEWHREYPTEVGRAKLDLLVHLAGGPVALEVKTAFCGVQEGQRWRLPSYSGGPKDGWILSDLLKLAALGLHAHTRRLLAVSAHPAPPASDWDLLLSAVSGRAPHLAIRLARLDELPQQTLAIGWLEARPVVPDA